ncbi:MAG: polysaccharide export outer membrane protein [Halioglobus sp.]|jgi:protein involved in polysaccharide export with SLBB domain
MKRKRRYLGSVFMAILAITLSSSAIAQDLDTYRLGRGDKIAIQVFDESDLTMTTVIGDSGFINYSYLGNIKVDGKTTVELEREITLLLKDGYLVSPSVNITISEYRPFFINGEVRRPGGYAFQPGLTLDSAIALAGGLSDRASRRRMYVQRADSEGAARQKISRSELIAPGDIIQIEEGFF